MAFGGLAQGLAEGFQAIAANRAQESGLQQAAGLFESLGTPEAGQFAQLLRSDPRRAAEFAGTMGGVHNVYALMRDTSVQQAAAKAAGAKFGLEKGKFELDAAQAEEAARHNRVLEQNDARKAAAAEQRAAKTGQGQDTEKPTVISSRLRGEFLDASKNFVIARDSMRRINASADRAEPADNIALVFSYMKLLDPQSTVREGEYATAENARGVVKTVRNAYNKVIRGERLTPEQRANFKEAGARQFNSFASGQLELEQEYARQADVHRVPREQVLVDKFGDMRPAAPEPPQGPGSAKIAGKINAPPAGTRVRNAQGVEGVVQEDGTVVY